MLDSLAKCGPNALAPSSPMLLSAATTTTTTCVASHTYYTTNQNQHEQERCNFLMWDSLASLDKHLSTIGVVPRLTAHGTNC